MLVCIHACVHVLVRACMHTCVYACTCVCACMHVCVHAYVHAFVHVCMHVCLRACVCVWVRACVYVYMCMCMYVHMPRVYTNSIPFLWLHHWQMRPIPSLIYLRLMWYVMILSLFVPVFSAAIYSIGLHADVLELSTFLFYSGSHDHLIVWPM